MSNSFERMKKLLGDYTDFSEHGISTGEIYAYSKAIELVYSLLSFAERSVYIAGEESELYYICDLLRLNTSLYSRSELINMIKERLSHSFAAYTFEDILDAFDSIGSGSLEIGSDSLTVSGVSSDKLGEAGKFLFAYKPFSLGANAGGNGLTFDEWDSFNESFGTYDSFLLPFDFIDTLRSEDIEQH